MSASVGSPTFRLRGGRPERGRRARRSVDRCTTARVGAVQIWPLWNPHTLASAVTAVVDVGVVEDRAPRPCRRARAAVASSSAPPAAEDPLADRGRAGEADHVDVRRLARARRPAPASAEVTTLTTPGGKPTSCMISASSRMASGSCGAGFITTVQPAASAGAILPAMLTSGKLYGVMHGDDADRLALDDAADQPAGGERSGRRRRRRRAGCRATARRPWRSARKRSIATGTCIREPTVAVAPVSAMISGTRSACAACERVGERVRAARARSAAGVRPPCRERRLGGAQPRAATAPPTPPAPRRRPARSPG